MQVSIPRAGGKLQVPYQTVAPGITRACQPQSRALPLSLRPCSLSLHTEVAPLQKDAMPQPPTRKPWATARPSQLSPGFTYVVGNFFFNLGILPMHFKVCLPHGLKVLLCLWSPEEVGQMVPMKLAAFLVLSPPSSVDSNSLNGSSALPAASITVIQTVICITYCLRSEIKVKLSPPHYPTTHDVAETACVVVCFFQHGPCAFLQVYSAAGYRALVVCEAV